MNGCDWAVNRLAILSGRLNSRRILGHLESIALIGMSGPRKSKRCYQQTVNNWAKYGKRRESPSAKRAASNPITGWHCSELNHPVVDGDAHIAEVTFVILDFVKQIAGADMAARYETFLNNRNPAHRPVFWAHPAGKNSYDRATVMLPNLYAQRLDECGIDFSIVYSTHGLGAMHIRDDEMRQVAHRALNTMFAEIFKDVADRMTPVAAIPCYTPEEAIAELDYAVGELGLKAIMVNSEIRKPVPEVAEQAPDLADLTTRIYPMALDAEFDFDPF